MILCEFTPTGSSMIRCSMDDYPCNNMWDGLIHSFQSLKLSFPYAWGGLAKSTFSDLQFFPNAFSEIGLPPKTGDIKLYWTDTDEVSKILIFDGTARRAEIDKEFIRYTLHRTENQVTTSSLVLSGTLNEVITTLCGALYLNLAIDASLARIVSPAVVYTVSSEIQIVDLVSEICAFFAHGAVIENDVLYLIDMLDNQSGVTFIDERYDDIEKITYQEATPVSLVSVGDYSIPGSDANGSPLTISTAYHNVEANILAALGNILTIHDRPTIQINCPIESYLAKLGSRYQLIDGSTFALINSSMLTNDVIYNFDEEKLQASGNGTMV